MHVGMLAAGVIDRPPPACGAQPSFLMRSLFSSTDARADLYFESDLTMAAVPALAWSAVTALPHPQHINLLHSFIFLHTPLATVAMRAGTSVVGVLRCGRGVCRPPPFLPIIRSLCTVPL